MNNTKVFRMVHSIVIQESMDTVFNAVIDVEKWPGIFPPCQSAKVIEENGQNVLIEITATVSGQLRTWQSQRKVDKKNYKVEFTQTKSFRPIISMTGYWIVEEEPVFGSRALLIHDFGIRADEEWTLELAEDWVRKACDKNSVSELTELKNALERPQRIGEVPVKLNFPAIRYDELLRKSAGLFPDKTALIYQDSAISFKHLDEMVDAMAHSLTDEFNIKPNDMIALTAAPCPEVIITFHAVSRIGAVVTPINPLYGAREIENQLRDSRAVFAVLSPSMYPLALGMRDRLSDLKYLIRFGPSSRFFESLNEHSGKSFYSPELGPDHLLALPYSSGTSGMPKGVMLTHMNLVSNALQFVFAHNVTNLDTMLNALPVLLSMHMGAGLASGATQILVDKWDVKGMMDLAEKYHATQVYTVTPLIAEMQNLPDLEEMDLSRLKFISSGASSLNTNLSRQLSKRLRIPVVQGFGLTEASPLTHATPVVDGYEIPAGTCGKPVPGTEQRIVNPASNKEAAPGEVGLLYLRGPQVMKGYWNDKEETAKALQDGWLCTGDLVQADDNGFLFYKDRYKDVIKHKGHSIAPFELESVMKSHPDVMDCAVVAVDISHDEQKPFAFVVLKADAANPAGEILNFANNQLAEYKRITGLEYIEKIPRSGSGKLLRRVLREKISEKAVYI